MAVLTTAWTKLSEKYLGNSSGNLYVRLYARYTEQDTTNNRTYVEYQARTYFSGGYIQDGGGVIGCGGTGISWSQTECTYVSGGEHTWVTRSGWLTHGANGKFSISATAKLSFPSFGWVGEITGYADLPQIPRQVELLSAPNFNDDENPTITYKNPAGSIVARATACISVTGTKDDVPYRAIDKNSGSYTFYLTSQERATLRNSCAGKTSINVTFFIKSTINGKEFYSTLIRTFSISNGHPTVNAYAQETNSTYTNLTGSSNKIIKGHNNVRAWMDVTPKKGATIKAQNISNGGQGTNGDSANYFNTSNNTFIFNVEDSYGQVVSKQVVLDMVDYSDVTCIAEVDRPTADGRMTVRASGKFFNRSFGYYSNNITVKMRYKEENGSYGYWQNMSVSTYGDDYNASITVSGLNYRKSYTVQVKAEDRIMSTETKPITVRSIPLFFWNQDGFSFNIPLNVKNGFQVGGMDMDYVIEQGISGDWFYRKWESGILEMWRHSDSTIYCSLSQPYNTRRYTLQSIETSGARFKSIEDVSVNTVHGMGLLTTSITSATIRSNGNVKIEFYIANDLELLNANIKIKARLIGRWK